MSGRQRPPEGGQDRYLIQYLECTDMGLNDTACSGPWHVLDRWLGRIVGFETSGEARGWIDDNSGDGVADFVGLQAVSVVAADRD